MVRAAPGNRGGRGLLGWIRALPWDEPMGLAVDPGGATPEQFVKIIDSDIAKFRDVAKAANLKFEE